MKKLFIIVFLFFIAFLLGVYLTWPQYLKFREGENTVNFLQNDFEKKKTYFEELEGLDEKLTKHKSALDKINTALPEESFLPSLFHFIQKRASASGLILSDVSPGKSIKGKEAIGKEEEKEKVNIEELYVNVSVAGTLSSFEDFLRAIEVSARMIEIDNVTLEESKEDELSFNLLLRTHYYKNQ